MMTLPLLTGLFLVVSAAEAASTIRCTTTDSDLGGMLTTLEIRPDGKGEYSIRRETTSRLRDFAFEKLEDAGYDCTLRSAYESECKKKTSTQSGTKTFDTELVWKTGLDSTGKKFGFEFSETTYESGILESTKQKQTSGSFLKKECVPGYRPPKSPRRPQFSVTCGAASVVSKIEPKKGGKYALHFSHLAPITESFQIAGVDCALIGPETLNCWNFRVPKGTVAQKLYLSVNPAANPPTRLQLGTDDGKIGEVTTPSESLAGNTTPVCTITPL